MTEERSSFKFTIWTVATLLTYILTYVAYRNFGPTEKHYSKWGGPPAVLVSTESTTRAALYYIFRPCITIEDAWYRLNYRPIQHGPEE